MNSELKKKNNIKMIVLTLVSFFVITLGVTYAFFTYTRDSNEVSKLITGEVYMHYIEGQDTISLEKTFPESNSVARSRTDNVVTFTIDGKNTTTNEDIYYEINLIHGEDIDGKTRLNDEDLKFDLIETIDGISETVVSGISFNDLNNQRIWVNTINRNTLSEVEITYQLRMWVNDDVLVSDTDENADYTTDVYKNSYANIKILVYGDFNWKQASTNVNCFTYNPIENMSYNYLSTFILDTSVDKVNTCKDYMLNTINGGTDGSDAGDGYQSYCEGTGTIDGWLTLKDTVAGNYYDDEQITGLAVITDYEFTDQYYSLNTDTTSVNTCKEYMYDFINGGSDYSDEQDEYESFCQGTGYADGADFKTWMNDAYFVQADVEYFESNGILTQESSQYTTAEISGYDVACGTDVVIPSQINGYKVVSIGDNSFKENGLTAVNFPKTIKYIGNSAFYGNSIKEVIIPKTVLKVSEEAFSKNPLINVEIKNSPEIEYNAFYRGFDKTIDKFTYNGTCQELNEKYSNTGMLGLTCNDWKPKQVITNDGTCEFENKFSDYCLD